MERLGTALYPAFRFLDNARRYRAAHHDWLEYRNYVYVPAFRHYLLSHFVGKQKTENSRPSGKMVLGNRLHYLLCVYRMCAQSWWAPGLGIPVLEFVF